MCSPLAWCTRLVACFLMETIETRHENCIALGNALYLLTFRRLCGIAGQGLSEL
jgi:hypothetical protein